ncbi:peroxisomal biogenesis factor 13 [Megachile rotundata]|uniref:peroxisomal biogenesis factor 13 n=1 Tax=Megachile rotundata TaxID=143995 RepID=UPI000258D5FF|nr:PREDICTED: peroxisomal membrane protein PEX13 [Megachile rotundata]
MAPERVGAAGGNQLKNVPNILPSLPGASAPFPSSNFQSVNPPPLPPRQPVQNYSGFNDYQRPFRSNYYGGYGHGYDSQYRGFGGYNSYSNYNNLGGFGGHSGDVENRFFQYIEDSTRPTFHVIETILHTFSSMTMLLESTYFALTNSFRAVLSVADNIGKLHSSLGQLFSTFALIRFVKWLYRKIVHGAGFQGQGTFNDELWDKSLAKIGNENAHNSSFWSGFLLFSVFFIIPYMIHKISRNIKNIQTKGKDPKEWHQYEEPAYIATVLYDFVARNNDELSVKAGQKLCLAPQSLQPKNLPGWYQATDNVNIGLVPYNYVKVIGQLKKMKKNNEEMTLNKDQLTTSEKHKQDNKENSDVTKSDENKQ